MRQLRTHPPHAQGYLSDGRGVGLIIHVDGGSRGNPGPAGAGVVIRESSGRLLYEAGYYLGRQTNNAAEYHALIRALERAAQAAPQPLVIHSDSELLVRQLTGEYQVKSPKLAPLHRQVQMLLLKLPRWTVRHVRREQNRRADELANLAMDERRDVVRFDADQRNAGDTAARQPGCVPSAADPAPVEDALRTAHKTADPGAGSDVSEAAAGTPRQAVQVSVTRAPKADCCPAGDFGERAFTVGTTLPAGLCVYAAHALLPTLLGMLNTDAEEFAAVPTLSVRCTHPACGAEFSLSPVRSPNGAGRRQP